jgi:hypothetical protein
MNSDLHPARPDDSEVSAYLANRLNESQAQAFEQYCLEHPNFARDVERELQLKVGLQQLNQPAKVTAIIPRTSRQTWWPVALAASVAIAALVFFEFRPASAPAFTVFRSLTDLPANLQQVPVTSIGLMQLRGDGAVPSVTSPVNGVVELRFLADPGLDYAIAATPNTSADVVLKIGGLRAAPDGYLRVYVPANQMIGKTWTISLIPAVFKDPKSEQTFRVQFAAASTPSG